MCHKVGPIISIYLHSITTKVRIEASSENSLFRRIVNPFSLDIAFPIQSILMPCYIKQMETAFRTVSFMAEETNSIILLRTFQRKPEITIWFHHSFQVNIIKTHLHSFMICFIVIKQVKLCRKRLFVKQATQFVPSCCVFDTKGPLSPQVN